eukprot:50313-Chlamydomonas_euryale.AAC.1
MTLAVRPFCLSRSLVLLSAMQCGHSACLAMRPCCPPRHARAGKPVCTVSVPLSQLLGATGIGRECIGGGGVAATAATAAESIGAAASGSGSGRVGGDSVGAAAGAAPPTPSLLSSLRDRARGALAALESKFPYDPTLWPSGRVVVKASQGGP